MEAGQEKIFRCFILLTARSGIILALYIVNCTLYYIIMMRIPELSPFGGAPLFFKPISQSTQVDIKNLASQGQPSGTVVMAGEQLAGRGRFADRKWMTGAPGENLAFSVFFRLADFPSLSGEVPLRVGLGVALGLEKALKLEPHIKWPNDVYLKGRKVAGILVESRDEFIFIGVGVNCGSKSYPKELKKTAISLKEAGNSLPPEKLLLPLLYGMKTALFEDLNWKEEVEKRLYAKGETVTFLPGISDGKGALRALLVGIQQDGQLLVQPEGLAGIKAFANGELQYTPPKKGFFARLGKS